MRILYVLYDRAEMKVLLKSWNEKDLYEHLGHMAYEGTDDFDDVHIIEVEVE